MININIGQYSVISNINNIFKMKKFLFIFINYKIENLANLPKECNYKV